MRTLHADKYGRMGVLTEWLPSVLTSEKLFLCICSEYTTAFGAAPGLQVKGTRFSILTTIHFSESFQIIIGNWAKKYQCITSF